MSKGQDCSKVILFGVILITIVAIYGGNQIFSIIREKKGQIVIQEGSQIEIEKKREMINGRQVKEIFHIGNLGPGFSGTFHFNDCEYSNCIFRYDSSNSTGALTADALIFTHASKYLSLVVPPEIRRKQLWFVYCLESPAFSHNVWSSVINSFDGTMTYRQVSYPVTFPYGHTQPRATTVDNKLDYAKGRSKGAYAYVSNCDSKQYNRLKTMRELAKYIDIDIFGGCTRKKPCPKKGDTTCEAKAHSQYRFYLAFENSLCKEYITEKFWKCLEPDGRFVPVALGGLSVEEYTKVAPPNSFVHAYNFTSIEQLGLYLKSLMTDDVAYNRYHEWRKNYIVSRQTPRQPVCDLCEAVNVYRPNFFFSQWKKLPADEWNNPENCKNPMLPMKENN